LITLGLVTGFFTCYGTTNIDSSLAWRAPFIILSCLSLLFSFASAFWLVASPRWLTVSGRQSEASAAWDMLGVSHAEREKVENQQQGSEAMVLDSIRPVEISDQSDASTSLQTGRDGKKHSFFDVFSADVRARTGLAAFMMGMQQLSGIDGVLYVRASLYALYARKLLKLLSVCTSSLRTSRSHFVRGLLSRLRCFCNCYILCDHSGSLFGG
jgi:DNA-directed RNA polymerase III subunit RPC2